MGCRKSCGQTLYPGQRRQAHHPELANCVSSTSDTIRILRLFTKHIGDANNGYEVSRLFLSLTFSQHPTVCFRNLLPSSDFFPTAIVSILTCTQWRLLLAYAKHSSPDLVLRGSVLVLGCNPARLLFSIRQPITDGTSTLPVHTVVPSCHLSYLPFPTLGL